MTLSISSNGNEVAVALGQMSQATAERVYDTVHRHGLLLQAGVKRRAREPRTSPRPSLVTEGPRLMTGDYNRSIHRLVTKRVNRISVTVGTNKVQAQRLEFGFVGTDSLGRRIDQKSYPHFGPAFDEQTAALVADLQQAVTNQEPT